MIGIHDLILINPSKIEETIEHRLLKGRGTWNKRKRETLEGNHPNESNPYLPLFLRKSAIMNTFL